MPGYDPEQARADCIAELASDRQPREYSKWRERSRATTARLADADRADAEGIGDGWIDWDFWPRGHKSFWAVCDDSGREVTCLYPGSRWQCDRDGQRLKEDTVTKRELKAELDELRAEVERLRTELSYHACDCTRHATPVVNAPSCYTVAPTVPTLDPADGWPPNVTCDATSEEASPCP